MKRPKCSKMCMTSQMYFLDSIYCCSYQRQHHKWTFSIASIVVPIRGICLCAHAKMCNNKVVNNYKPREESSDILIRKIGICCRSSHCVRSLCIHCMINDPQQPLWSPGKSRKAMDFSRFLEKPPDVFEFFGLYIYIYIYISFQAQLSQVPSVKRMRKSNDFGASVNPSSSDSIPISDAAALQRKGPGATPQEIQKLQV